MPGLSSWRRYALLLGGVVVVLLVGVVVVASLPFVQTVLIGRAFAVLEARYGIVGRTASIDIDLARLDIRVRGLSLATRERPDEPFFTVDDARVDVPWSAAWGGVSVETIAMVNPTVSVRTDADGSSNLPLPSGSADVASDSGDVSSDLRVPIGSLTLRDFTMQWVDELRGLSVDVGRTTLEMSGDRSRISGPIRLADRITLDLADDGFALTEVEGQLSFDGSAIGFDRLLVAGPEATVTASGELADLFSAPAIDLTFESSFALSAIAAHLEETRGDGTLVFAGRLSGSASDPTAAVSVSADRVIWNAADLERLDGQLELSTAAARVETLSVQFARGTVTASGTVSLVEGVSSELSVWWDAVDADTLLESVWPAAPVRVGRSMTGRLALGWTTLDLRSVTVQLESVGAGSQRSGTLTLIGDAGRYTLSVDQGLGRAARITGVVSATVGDSDWTATTVTGDLDVTCPDLALCRGDLDLTTDTAVPAALAHLGGNLAASFRFGGTAGVPTVDSRVNATASGVNGLPPIRIDLDLSADTTGLDISSASVSVGENHVRGQVATVWEGGALRGRVDGELADVAAFDAVIPDGWAPSSGRVRFVADLGGALATPSLELVEVVGAIGVETLRAGTPDALPLRATIDLRGSGQVLPTPNLVVGLQSDELWWGDARVGRVTTDVAYDPERTIAVVAVEEFGISGRVVLEATDTRPFVGELRVTSEASGPYVRSLSRLGSALDLPLTGDLSLDASFRGSLDALTDTTAEATLQLSDARFGDAVLAFGPSAPTIRYSPDAVAIDDFDLTLDESRLTLEGVLSREGAGRMTARLSGAVEDLLVTASAIPESETWLEGLDASGLLTADVSATGWVDDLVFDGRVEIRGGRIGVGDHPTVDALNLQVVHRQGLTEIAEFAATWQGAAVTATGAIPQRFWMTSDTSPEDNGLATLQVRVDSISQEMLVGYLADETLAEINGSATAMLDLEADAPALDAVRATLTVDDAALSVSGVPLAQRRPTRLSLRDRQLLVEAFDWGNDIDYLTLGGSVGLEDDFLADLTATGSLDLVALSAFTAGAGVGVEGQADLIANILGPVSLLDLTGTIELSDVGVRVAEPRLVVSSLNGALLLSRDTLTPFDLRGELNGGPIEISGELRRVDFLPQGTVRFTGREIAMNVPDGLSTELEADISLTLQDDDTLVSGTTVITRGAYREPMSLTGGVLSVVDSRQQVRVVGLDEAGPLDAVQLDIEVVTAEDIVLDNNYLDALLTGDIRLGGTIGAPAVTGRVALLEGGRIRVGTRTYDIESGAIDLVSPTDIDPRVDIRARTSVRNYDITLSITGGQDDLETSFQSDPPLPEPDIVSVLLTGQTLSESADDQGAGAREQALGLVSGELLGSAGRQLGLDVRVGQDAPTSSGQIRFDSSLIAGETDPSTRLTVARRLNDRVELILSQDLRGSGLSWIVNYLASDNVELRGLFEDDSDRAYEFLHALDFAAPPRSERFGEASVTTRTSSRISMVEFSGSTGFPVSELLDVIRHRVDDDFDFHRWQQDQDRLRRFYSDRGFFEARVTARRDPLSTPGEVGLSYEITRGPRTRLVVEGYDLPGSVRTDLELAWELSVFTGFLLEELQTLTRTHLRTEGFLQAGVEADLTADDPDEKVITLRIVQGTRTDTRELRFDGNQVIDEVTLTAFAAAVFEDGGEWGNPALLEDALVRLYRQQGRLEVVVDAGSVEFDGAIARLPIAITEGRLFVIAQPELFGVSARPEPDVRAELALEAGTPYGDRAVQDAITGLERGYRRLGFNAARVSAESTVDTERAEVRLAVTVREGRQEILQQVVVEGGSRTHPRLVSNALELDIGEPVDLTEWNLARKRLYDTEVFRTVDLRVEATQPSSESTVTPVRARVLLEEWPLYNVQYGLRVNDLTADTGDGRDLGLGFAADASRRNLFGRGATVGTALRTGTRGRAVRGYVRMPRSFGLPIRSTVFVERSRAERGEVESGFVEDLTTLTLEQRLQLPLDARLTYSASFDRNHSFEEVPTHPDFPFDLEVDIFRLASNVVLDRRNDLFNATQGWFHSSLIEYGREPGGGDIRFAKYLAQQYQHWNPGGRVVVASGGRIGLATGLGDTLITTERFFVGGGNTVRGYAQDGLGPKSFFGDARGGNALLILNQEVRFPIAWRIGGVGFVDAGNVFETTSEISFGDLVVGTGLGLRVDTPVGLLRFDYGFAFSREPDEPVGRFHFSIGQAF